MVEETDHKVCYGYLLRLHPEEGANRIVTDVWLYNLAPAPETGEWTLPDARQRLPFLNAAGFVAGDGTLSSGHPGHIEAKWSADPEGKLMSDVYVDGVHFARMNAESKPGWSKLAIRKNAIAIPLDDLQRR